MNLLIRKATIIDENSPHHQQQQDILIRHGIIESIEPEINVEGLETLDADNVHVSPGWLDIGVQSGDPGYEHREDLRTVANAAKAGGFTALACQPNTNPAIHSKSEVLYIKHNTSGKLVDFFPLGAVSRDCKGEEITEMIDMFQAGAISFTDGKNAIQHNGLMLRALQYVKTFDGILINQPLDHSIAQHGQMHEGEVSTSLGMKGLPSLAEDLMVQRDLFLTEYADSRLHVANVSTARSVELIRQAKARGIRVTASVAVLNLAFEDGMLRDFDANFKTLPPLREATDRRALLEGLADGTIDFICSNHVPVEEEGKKLEFSFADFGAIGLETAFGLANSALENVLSLEELIAAICNKPRKIFNLNQPVIEVGQLANLTIFDPTLEWKLEKKDLRSRSSNTPLLGHTLKGKVLGVMNNHKSAIFLPR